MSKREVLWLLSALSLAFSILMVGYYNPREETPTTLELLNGSKKPVRFSYSDPPAPPRKSTNEISESLYIAIIDREYESAPIQCDLKTSWIDDALKLSFVDGVEFYSSASFTNKECGITSISFNATTEIHNPSCLIMQNVIKSFLERSDAGWLLYVPDGAFVDITKLKELLFNTGCWDPTNSARIFGHCSELRDYFQVFAQNSGGLMSRSAAMKLNFTDHTWDVACAIEIEGNEALAHALDINLLYAISNHNQQFLGHPFVSKSDYDALLSGNFGSIKACPASYESRRVCHASVQKLSDLVVWAGEGEHMEKTQFVRNAKHILESVTDDVNFIYNVYQAELCMNK